MPTAPAASGAGGQGMVEFFYLDWDLKDPGLIAGGIIPTQNNGQPYDTCSITSETIPPGTSFGTGVVTVYKSNSQHDTGTALTPTITTETTSELTGTGWFKAGFLKFRVSTAAGATVKVRLTVRMARLGFSV